MKGIEMICYKDMTFCTFYDECEKGETCDRALTDGVKEGAEDWYGSKGAPICRYLDKPKCFKEIE